MIIISILKIALYILVLLCPLLLIDILSGWTFLLYPLYISTYILLANVSLKHTKANNEEPPDSWHDTEYMSDIGKSMVVGSQAISALIFFIIFALNDGEGAFSTLIIGSIILAIVIPFRRYLKPVVDSYKKLIVWMFGFYKKY
jgi:hypothetical protein